MKQFFPFLVNFTFLAEVVLKTTMNIVLAFLMVLLTTGITITQHFCHNRLQNTGIFTVAESCKKTESCCSTAQVAHCKSGQVQKEDCCTNENVFVKFLSQFTVNKSAQVVAFLPLVSHMDLLSSGSIQTVRHDWFLLKHPPGSPSDIQALFSVFLL